jgi:hypothetical protein
VKYSSVYIVAPLPQTQQNDGPAKLKVDNDTKIFLMQCSEVIYEDTTLRNDQLRCSRSTENTQ